MTTWYTETPVNIPMPETMPKLVLGLAVKWEFIGVTEYPISMAMLYKALRPASPGSSKSYYRKVVIAEDITDLKCDVLTDTCFLLVLRSTGLKLIRVFNKGVNKPQLLDALDSTEDNIVLLYTQSPHGVVFDITKQTDDNTNQFGRIPTSIKEYHELKNKIRNG